MGQPLVCRAFLCRKFQMITLSVLLQVLLWSSLHSNECVAMSDSGVIALLTCLSSLVVNTIEATTRTALKKLKQNKILNNKNYEVCRIAAEQFCQAQIVKCELQRTK